LDEYIDEDNPVRAIDSIVDSFVLELLFIAYINKLCKEYCYS